MIRRCVPVFLTALWVLTATVAAAQSAPAGAMPSKMALTIGEAIELAWQNNIEAIRQRNALQRSEAEKLRSRSTWLPRLDLTLGWRANYPGRIEQLVDPNTGKRSFVVLENFYSYQFTLQQPLFNSRGGSYLHVPKAAGAQVDASEEDLRARRQLVALQAKTKCYDLLKSQRLADVQQRAVQRSIEQLETSKARYELGSASMSDFLKSKVQLGNDSLELITRLNAIEVDRAELNNFLALDVSRATAVDVEFEFEPYPLPAEEAIVQAVDHHPAVMAREYDLKRWSTELGGTQFSRLPSIDFVGTYAWGSFDFADGLNSLTELDAYSFGVQLNWNLFSGFSTSANVKQAKVSKHEAESELAQSRRDVRLEIKTAALGVNEGGQRFRVAEDQVESAQEDLDIAQEKYNLGAATILDILVAQVNLSSAETGRIQAGYDWLLSIAELERAMGGGD